MIHLSRFRQASQFIIEEEPEFHTMSDLTPSGGHRKSATHLELKNLCAVCVQQFRSRSDYENHLQSLEHLRKAAKRLNDSKQPRTTITQKGGGKVLNGIPVEAMKCFFDYKDLLPENIDKYWYQPIGIGLIKMKDYYMCSLCTKFFDTLESVQLHAQGFLHHRNFWKYLKEKSIEINYSRKRVNDIATPENKALEEKDVKKRKIDSAIETVNPVEVIEINSDDEENEIFNTNKEKIETVKQQKIPEIKANSGPGPITNSQDNDVDVIIIDDDDEPNMNLQEPKLATTKPIIQAPTNGNVMERGTQTNFDDRRIKPLRMRPN